MDARTHPDAASAYARADSPLDTLLLAQRRAQRGPLALAAAAAAVGAVAGVALLGLSGWFVTAAGLAGLTGAAAFAFNYLLPSAAIRLAAICRTAGRYVERLSGHAAALRALARIRPALFMGVAGAPAPKALQLSAGEGCARLIDDVGALQTQFVRRPARWGVAAALAAGLGLASLAGWRCLILLALLAAVQILGGRLAALGLARRWGREIQAASGRLKDACGGLLGAAPEIAAYGLQDWAADQVSADSRALGAARLAMHRGEAWQAAASTALTGAGAAAMILCARHGSPATAVLAALAALGALEACAVAAREAQEEPGYRAARDRLAPWISSSPPAPERQAPAKIWLSARTGGVFLEPGDRLVITGRSGCGKTSLLDRLLKLSDGRAGEAEMGSVDLTRLTPSAARAQFAYAPQSPTLLAGTVRENLRLGDPFATEARMWDALADAALQARIEANPTGLDADVGEGGARLSGGEGKRLSLARAYLRQSPWLVLDEPTEGLDGAAEATVVARLEQRLRRTGQGLLLVSHRPAPRALCARQLALD